MSSPKSMYDYLNYVGEQSPDAKQFLVANSLNKDGVFVPRAWLHLLDGNAYHALVMGRIMFWADINVEKRTARMVYERDGHLWMVKTYQDIANEIGLNSAKTVRNALDSLRKKEFIFLESHHSPFHTASNNAPMKVAHIRPNWKCVMEALNKWIDSEDSHGSPLEGQPKESPLEGITKETPLEGQSLYQVDTGKLTNSSITEGGESIIENDDSTVSNNPYSQVEDDVDNNLEENLKGEPTALLGHILKVFPNISMANTSKAKQAAMERISVGGELHPSLEELTRTSTMFRDFLTVRLEKFRHYWEEKPDEKPDYPFSTIVYKLLKFDDPSRFD